MYIHIIQCIKKKKSITTYTAPIRKNMSQTTQNFNASPFTPHSNLPLTKCLILEKKGLFYMPMKTDHQQLITHVHIDTLEVCIICRAGRARWTVVIIATAEVLLNLLLLLIVIANHFGFF